MYGWLKLVARLLSDKWEVLYNETLQKCRAEKKQAAAAQKAAKKQTKLLQFFPLPQ